MAAGSNSTGELGVLQEHNEGRNKAAGWQQSSEEESDGADEADGEGDSTPTLLGEEGRCGIRSWMHQGALVLSSLKQGKCSHAAHRLLFLCGWRPPVGVLVCTSNSRVG